MRVTVVEDIEATREGLRIILTGEPGIEVAGIHADAEAALEVLASEAPDVLLVDLGLPGLSGLELIRRVRASRPSLEILVYTIYDDWQTVYAALRAGATGYVTKGVRASEVIEAIRAIAVGGSPMSPKIARMVIADFQSAGAAGAALTEREREILHAMARGSTYKEIAAQFGVSPHTVRTHIRNIYEKLQATNKLDALAKARGL